MRIELTIFVLVLVIATSVAIGSISFNNQPHSPGDSMNSGQSVLLETDQEESVDEMDPCEQEKRKGISCTYLEMEEEIIEVW